MLKSGVPFWRRRRLLWPAAAVVLLLGALLIALANSRTSQVVIYNETGENVGELTVTACGQSRVFHDLRDRDSVHFALDPTGSESELALFTNAAAPALWHGDYIEPRGGYRAVVRLRRDGEVECRTSVSWWQRP